MARHHTDPGPIKFRNADGKPITSWKEWEAVFSDKGGQFVKHRSAYSIAEFMWEGNGDIYLRHKVSQLCPESVEFHHAVPELEVRFDKFGKGRFHDLGIYGRGRKSGQSLFVGVEAKVDEPFGDIVKNVYDQAIAKREDGISTNAPERILNLLDLHFPDSSEEMWETRYQLLYATAGTLAARAGLSVLYIIVFVTPLFDPKLGKQNKQDFDRFMKLTGATLIGSKEQGDAYKLTLGGKDLYCVYEYFNLGR